MAIIAFRNLSNVALHGSLDYSELQKIALADGTTFGEMAAELNTAVQLASQEALAHPLWGGMFSVQDTPAVKYGKGANQGFVEITDRSKLDPQMGERDAHMLPRKLYGGASGYTHFGLMDAERGDIEADIMTQVANARDHYPKRLLTRFFSNSSETVGSTGKSLPFADGTASSSGFVPPKHGGKTFADTHTHFVRDATLNDASVNAAIYHLYEHGHNQTFTIVASETDVSTWRGLDGFLKPDSAEANRYGTTDDFAAQPFGEDRYIGAYDSEWGIAKVYATSRIPTGYYGCYKSYGSGNAGNPLRVQIDPRMGFGFRLMSGVWITMPEHLAVVVGREGFGVGADRTNGVCVKIDASGNYTAPTIS